MSEDEPRPQGLAAFLHQSKFVVLIGGVIGIAIVLVAISMALYTISGTAQLDLSRPGYEDVSKEAVNDKDSFEYSATGQINEKSLDEFEKLYTKQAEGVKAVDAFGGDPLAPETLGIDEVAEPATE